VLNSYIIVFKANKVHGVVLVERTAASTQYFADLQRLCGLEMGLMVIPVAGPEEAAGVLVQMVCHIIY